jgi:hypothetical protein
MFSQRAGATKGYGPPDSGIAAVGGDADDRAERRADLEDAETGEKVRAPISEVAPPRDSSA